MHSYDYVLCSIGTLPTVQNVLYFLKNVSICFKTCVCHEGWISKIGYPAVICLIVSTCCYTPVNPLWYDVKILFIGKFYIWPLLFFRHSRF